MEAAMFFLAIAKRQRFCTVAADLRSDGVCAAACGELFSGLVNGRRSMANNCSRQAARWPTAEHCTDVDAGRNTKSKRVAPTAGSEREHLARWCVRNVTLWPLTGVKSHSGSHSLYSLPLQSSLTPLTLTPEHTHSPQSHSKSSSIRLTPSSPNKPQSRPKATHRAQSGRNRS